MPETILICTDLDRTLLPNGEPPESPQAREIFGQFCQQDDVILAYVSGRDKGLLQEAIEEYRLPVPDYAIGDVGSSLYHIHETDWELDSRWSQLQEDDWGGRHHDELHALLININGLELQEAEKQNSFKLSYYFPLNSDHKMAIKQMRSIFEQKSIHSNIIWSIDEAKHVGLIDVLPEAADKLKAIRFLGQSLGIAAERTLFSGDSGNDLSVLTSEIPATLVANASASVREEAQREAKQHQYTDQLYLAKGNFYGLNGNYSAGILEGIYHYFDDTHAWFAKRLG